VVLAVPSQPSPHALSEGRVANGTGGYDALSRLVLLVGICNGVAPLLARLVFDGNVLRALPLRLAKPWWWLTSLALIVTTVLLAVIDNAKQHDTETERHSSAGSQADPTDSASSR
jgi:hypothetical protein